MAETNDGRGPYQLDPFTHIVAIHFPRGEKITKLDFVNGRYMVYGQDQTLADVLGQDESFWTADQQRALVKADQGLDMQAYESDGVTLDLLGSPPKAYLKNKIDVVTKESPGAANEFLRGDSTVVIEFDWLELNTAYTNTGSTYGVDVFYEFLRTADEAGNVFAIASAEIAGHLDGSTPYTESIPYAYSPISEPYYSYPDPDGTLGVTPVDYDGLYFYPLSYLEAGGYALGSGPAYFWGGSGPAGSELSPIFSYSQPPDYIDEVSHSGTSDDDWYQMTNAVAVYDDPADSGIAINGRLIGATPDTFSPAPMSNGALTVPYGRVRVAVTVDGTKLIASVNGGDAVTLTAAPSFTLPRPYPTDEFGAQLDYYKIEPGTTLNTFTYAVIMQHFGVMRCMWLMRKKRTAAQLKVMSAVKPLPAADSPKWKKPPGSDQ